VDGAGFYLEVSVLLGRVLLGRMWRFGHRHVSVNVGCRPPLLRGISLDKFLHD